MRAKVGVKAWFVCLALVLAPAWAWAAPPPAKSAAEVQRLEQLTAALDARIAQLRELLAKVAAQTQEVVGKLEPLAAESRPAKDLQERLAKLRAEMEAREKALADLLAKAVAPQETQTRLSALEEQLGQARRALEGLGRDLTGIKDQAAAAPKAPPTDATAPLAAQVKALGEEAARLREGAARQVQEMNARLDSWLWWLWGLVALVLALGALWVLTFARARRLEADLNDLRARTKSALVKLSRQAG